MGEIKETPAQEEMRKNQAQTRLALGATIAARDHQAQPEAKYTEAFIFRFRMYENTTFHGLWRLEILNKFGQVEETITDADSLPNALEAIGNIFANKGF